MNFETCGTEWGGVVLFWDMKQRLLIEYLWGVPWRNNSQNLWGRVLFVIYKTSNCSLNFNFPKEWMWFLCAAAGTWTTKTFLHFISYKRLLYFHLGETSCTVWTQWKILYLTHREKRRNKKDNKEKVKRTREERNASEGMWEKCYRGRGGEKREGQVDGSRLIYRISVWKWLRRAEGGFLV